MNTETAGKLIRRKDIPELNADQIIWKANTVSIKGPMHISEAKSVIAYETSKQVRIESMGG